jgi:hypothetical protein
MFRKNLLALLIALALFAVLVTPALAAKDYLAERFDVQFDLQPDGSALVTETVVFRFNGGPFTYAFREIAATETDGVTFVAASMDGDTMPLGTQAGQVEVTGRDPLKVTWHFAPTSDTTHEFVVRYRVNGVVRTGDVDTIRWRAIPEEHAYPIERSSITLTYPKSARLLEPPMLDRAYESSALPIGYRLTTTDIPDDQEVILTAHFAAGTAAETTPLWQIRQQQAEAAGARALPIGLVAAVATLVFGSTGLFVYARAQRREPIGFIPTTFNTPPDDLPPALVGKLTGQAEGGMGTLFDLAQRGVLEVHEDKGWWGTKKYTLERTNASAPLTAYEQRLLAAIFKPGETTVDMSAVSTRLASQHKALDSLLDQELINRGWLDPDRKRQRRKLSVFGSLLLIGSIGLFLLGMIGIGAELAVEIDRASSWAVVVGAAVGGFAISLGLLIYAVTFSPLTPEGEAEAARWQSFAKYLKQTGKDQSFTTPVNTFEQYLPLAAAFGLGSVWAKHFQRMGGAPLPAWFHARPGSEGDFGAIVAVMSASDSAGTSAASGGGAGASGGGSSGAG